MVRERAGDRAGLRERATPAHDLGRTGVVLGGCPDGSPTTSPDGGARTNRFLAPKGAHMASAISTTDLTKHYSGVRALEGLSIEVPQGSIYGFLGANGAGKTTALKILAGLSRPTS